MPDDRIELIGGEFCHDKLDPRLILHYEQELTQYERDQLWKLFQKIGYCWDNLYYKNSDSSNLRSSWLEFIEAKQTPHLLTSESIQTPSLLLTNWLKYMVRTLPTPVSYTHLTLPTKA